MAKKKTETKKTKAPVLSRYYTAQNVELLRSEIHFADYNPRTIDPENLKTLKRGIKNLYRTRYIPKQHRNIDTTTPTEVRRRSDFSRT